MNTPTPNYSPSANAVDLSPTLKKKGLERLHSPIWVATILPYKIETHRSCCAKLGYLRIPVDGI